MVKNLKYAILVSVLIGIVVGLSLSWHDYEVALEPKELASPAATIDDVWCENHTHYLNETFINIGGKLNAAEANMNRIKQEFGQNDRLLCSNDRDGNLKLKQHDLIIKDKNAVEEYNRFAKMLDDIHRNHVALLRQKGCSSKWIVNFEAHYNSRKREQSTVFERICFKS